MTDLPKLVDARPMPTTPVTEQRLGTRMTLKALIMSNRPEADAAHDDALIARAACAAVAALT